MSRLPTLALFDLDHTLLSGDSDVLWCGFLVRHGLLPQEHLQRNAQMERDYRAGTVTVEAFSSFYVGQLAGRSPAFWVAWRQRFLDDEIMPRVPADAFALLDQHRAQGHRLVLTTATNRVITALTAQALGIADLIATEVDLSDGIYSGQTTGVLNMRDGKVTRLLQWLAGQGLGDEERRQTLADAWFYSDSANDLPLLCAVGRPVAVDPDERLAGEALRLGWPIRKLRRLTEPAG